MLLGRTCLQALAVKTFAGTGMAAGSASFTTAHGVVDRVHHHAAVARTASEPAAAAGFTAAFERVLAVAYGADGGTACGKNLAGFTGR